MKGKEQALLSLGEDCTQMYKLETSPFKKYKTSFRQNAEDVDKISRKINEVENEISERMRNNTISKSDKASKYSELKLLRSEKELKLQVANKISKNWSIAVDKMRKNGPEKKKPGRKQKDNIQYLPARELKKQLGSIIQKDVGKTLKFLIMRNILEEGN